MSIDELLPDARDLKRELGGVPSKNALQKTLRVGWDKVSQVHRQLTAEDVQRADERRTAMRRLGARKNPRFRVPASSGVLPVPISPAVHAVAASPLQVAAVGVSEEPAVDPAEVSRSSSGRVRRVVTWPALVVAAPAAVAIWAGWVAIGKLTGFGKVNLLPGVGRGWVVDTAITLPIGVEAYAAYAFYVALNPAAPDRARRFAAWSAGLAVLLGMGGQTAYHLMAAAGMTAAPWQITTVVSCLPVGVFAVVAALVHMVRAENNDKEN